MLLVASWPEERALGVSTFVPKKIKKKRITLDYIEAGDADRWGTATLGGRPGNGEASLFLPCERGSHSHTVVITSPRLSLAL